MPEGMIIQLIYKVIMTYFVVIFVTNLFSRKAKLPDQIMYAVILIPFALRILSIR